MRYLVQWIAWCWLLLLPLHPALADDVCPTAIRVQLDLHAPSAYLDAQKQVRGMDAELVSAIFKQAGCPFEFSLTPMTGARILKSLQDGEIDLMIRASKNEERQAYAYFTEPYRQEVVGVFSRKSLHLPENLTLSRALQIGLRLIGPASGFYGDDFEQLRQGWRDRELYTSYPDAKVATELLFATPSRGELMLVDADIFFYYAGAGRLADIQQIGSWLHISPAHLMLSKKTASPELIQRLNTAIAQLHKNGSLRRIEQRYRPELLRLLLQRHAQNAVRKAAKPLK